MAPLVLWYPQPAKQWVEALPVGNGRLGAMVFGGTAQERIQFNEDTIWTGQPHDYSHDGAAQSLPEIRKLLFEGRQKEAEKLASERFMSVPLRQKAYQPAGDLLLDFPANEQASDYRRDLDIDSAIAAVSYKAGQGTWRREVFSSAPDQVIVVRLTADQKGRLEFRARLSSPHAQKTVKAAGPRHLTLQCQVADSAIQFEARKYVPFKMDTMVWDYEVLEK